MTDARPSTSAAYDVAVASACSKGHGVRQLDDRAPHAVAVELGPADAGVGARDDADAVLQGQAQLLGAGDAHGVGVQAEALHQLPQRRREGTHPDRRAVPADGRVDDDPGRGDGVEQVGRGAQALLGEAGEVLEAVDAGVDGVPRARAGSGCGRGPGARPRARGRRSAAGPRRRTARPAGRCPGVSMPPDAITLTTSTPRSTCSAMAERIASAPSAAPPR